MESAAVTDTRPVQAPAFVLNPRFTMEAMREDLERNFRECRKQEEKRRKEEAEGKTPLDVLAALLSRFSKVDFRQLAGLEEGEKLKQKEVVFAGINEIIRLATENDWGLCLRNGMVYVYNGKRWCPVDPSIFKRFMTDALCRMGARPKDAKYYKMQDELYSQFIGISALPAKKSDPDTVLVNLQNGTMEFADGKPSMREHRRDDFLTYVLPFRYDKEARCPMFDKYLNRVLPDRSSRHVLAEYMGYVFTKGMKLEKVLLLYGTGANGKSVFFEVMNALLGKENICSYSLSSLTKTDSYERPELQDKLLNYSPEINGKLESNIFKQLASGEPVQARRIYCKPFTIENYAKLMFNCNELPKETERTNAFFRRFLIIPFKETIPEEEQDPELARRIIRDELPGVFNWVLDGLERLVRQGKFSPCEAAKEELERFKRESDSVAMFVEETNVSAGSLRIGATELYKEYKSFCFDNGFSACSLKNFSQRMAANGFERRRDGIGSYFLLSFPEK